MLYGGSFGKVEDVLGTSNPLDDAEHVEWLVENGRVEDAELAIGTMEGSGRALIEDEEREERERDIEYKKKPKTQQNTHSVRCWDQRLTVSGLQQTGDAATAMAIHTSYLIIGTQKGRVLITEYDGTTLHTYDEAHTAAVTDISFDTRGKTVATCSRDGTVCILSLTGGSTITHTFSDPLRAVALDPGFTEPYRFAAGGKDSMIHIIEPQTGLSKLFSNKEKRKYISTTGIVQAIKWKGELLAWGTDATIHLHDIKRGRDVEIPLGVDLPHKESETKCMLCWEREDTLLVGWGGVLLCLCVMPKPTVEQKKCKDRFDVEILQRYEISNGLVCGVAPFGEKVIALTLPLKHLEGDVTPTSMLSKRVQPELRVLSRHVNKDLEEELIYRMNLTGVENLFPIHYHLCVEESPDAHDLSYFILTPLEIIAVGPRDALGHVTFLASSGRVKEAVHCISILENSGRTSIAQEEDKARTARLKPIDEGISKMMVTEE